MKFSRNDVLELIKQNKECLSESLVSNAQSVRKQHFGNSIYVRGLIEFSNYCKNNCKYCGIRCMNTNVHRYRLTKEQILECCEIGSKIGFKTFVLQGGDDPGFSDNEICEVVEKIKEKFPDSAVTLSVGERKKSVYKSFFDAGADRYLLRHETANEAHYSRLHPDGMALSTRKQCLFDLKDIGFQVGAGFMVGSPYQTDQNLADDIMFLMELEPHMVGIGPFVPHKMTEFKDFKKGSMSLTLAMLCITRLALPKVLLPSTTALGTIAEDGQVNGILCGANVVMPNLSPMDVRQNYSLYDGKKISGAEAAEGIKELQNRFDKIGYTLDFSRGDSPILSNSVCEIRGRT